jgi:ribonuclease HI
MQQSMINQSLPFSEKSLKKEKGRITLWFDGAAWLRSKASYGFVIKDDLGIIKEDSGVVPCEAERSTSNVGEHFALYSALSWLKENGYTDNEIVAFGDSTLVIKQIFGGWKCRDFSLPYAPFYEMNKNIVKLFKRLEGKWIPREQNEHADNLSKKGLRTYSNNQPEK